jgi:hypothetical protein
MKKVSVFKFLRHPWKVSTAPLLETTEIYVFLRLW